ncbi:MAG: hypothetical protein PHU40_11380 [Sulfurimonas sp.]|nr:hypothetical protein [Sulfurimonas sp.]
MKKIVLIAALCITTMSFASEKERGDQREIREPPKEAIAVCKDQAEDSKCSITTPRGDTMEGTCKSTPDEKYFACMPDKRAPR